MISSVLEFFGIIGLITAPATVFELFQWVITVAVGVGLVVFVLRFIRYIVVNIMTGGRNL